MTNDDDLGPAYSRPPSNAHPADIAERVMKMPEHRHLSENEITFGWLMRNEPKVKGGKVELGSVHETQHMGQGGFKDLFEQLLEGMLGYLPQFVVVINAEWWRGASPIEHEALVFHELLHVQQKQDKYGAPKFNKDGLPVYGCRGHDIEAFTAEVLRYGPWHADIQNFLDAMRSN